MKDKNPQYINELIKETSPYLLQHAHNPVNWKAWNDQSLELAKKQDKLLIISVGYSACHWCHVMEHESFENEAVAEIMNRNFINIKVDREERPDIDQVYMNAVQLMTGMGGWPMNVVALPDGRPVWGGTYFRKEQWMDALKQLSTLYQTKPGEMKEYASRLEEGLQKLQLIDLPKEEVPFSSESLEETIQKWKKDLDNQNGGSKGGPKFMLPSNQNFLLRYSVQEMDEDLKKYSLFSLDKISYGGIFDHVGGGFSRYSVDERWHVPHFEKMLYDNAQLVSLYSNAYKLTKNEHYKNVIEKTLEFISEELKSPENAFYSALDADSFNEKGKTEEGAYYTWTKEELEELLQEDFKLFSVYFNINKYGLWEKGQYVLIRTKSLEEIAEEFKISEEEVKNKIETSLRKLKNKRNDRHKPGLDDKILTSWNALMLTGYLDAYSALGNEAYLNMALKNANFIKTQQITNNGRLFHSFKNGESKINGYLEDYAFTIEAFLKLYETTFEESWLKLSEDLCQLCLEDFSGNSPLLYFTSNKDKKLITRTMETMDNVIPASNSVMAKNLFKLSGITGNRGYHDLASRMLKTIQPQIKSHPQSYANWLELMLNFTNDFYEVAITGKDALSLKKEIIKEYLPNILVAGTEKSSEVSVLKSRFKNDENLIYICSEGKCELPISSVEEAIKRLKDF